MSLDLLFTAIQQARSKAELRSQVIPSIGEYFSATRRAVFFFDELLANDPTLQTILNTALSIDRNPVARYLAERHAPVHEAMVTTPKTWQLICPRADHWHVMAGPIVHRGNIVRAIGCTRARSMPAFNHDNLVDLSAICLHISGWMAIVEATKNCDTDAPVLGINTGSQAVRQCLTARELQIAELVALGKTNAEIGTTLWITENSVKQALKRMFRKLGVSSRAAMVAKLANIN
nr:helix-turn-helix transcriptional regulator [Alkalinema sp. FACHB-956]